MLREKTRELGCSPVAVGSALDHVHVLIRLGPGANVAELAKRLKGTTARQINLGARLPLRLKWQSGYWAETVAPSEAHALAGYVSNQRQRHDDSHPAEQWQLYDSYQREPASGGL